MIPLENNKALTHSTSNLSMPEQTPLPSNASLAITGPFPPLTTLPGTEGASATTPTVGALVVALKRRWITAGTLGTIAAVATIMAISVLFPAKYVAQARLELASRPAPPLFTGAREAEVDPAIYRASQQAIVKSPLVLSNALNSDKLKSLKLTGLSADALEKSIKVDFAQGPEIMTIKLYGDDPEHLADLLNAVITAYKEEVENRENQRKRILIDQLEKSFSDNQKRLSEKRAELHSAEREEKLPDPQLVQISISAAASKVATYENELRVLRTDLYNKKRDLTSTKARLLTLDKEPISATKLQLMIHADSAMIPFAADLAAIDKQIRDWEPFPDSDNKKNQVENLKQKRKSIEEGAKTAEKAIRPEIERKLRQELQESLEHDVLKLSSNIEDLKNQETDVFASLEKARSELEQLNNGFRRAGVRIENLRDEVKQIEKTQDTLSAQAALLRAEPAASKRIMVLQPAETPTDKDYSRLTKMGSAGGLGMFGLVLFGVAFMEFRSRRVSGVDEVTSGLGLPLVGTMPKLPPKVQRPIPGALTQDTLHWQSVITESVDAIRTQLLHASRTDAVHVVMVTSAAGGEGKTSLASQLAASLARAWRKTLLVDGDFRNPAAHKLFNLPLEPGFSELLRNESNLSDVVKPTLLSRLWLMPAGHWDAHAIQALAQDNVGAIFDQMKEQYDFIVVDSCPVLPVADSLLLGQHVDAVIFSVLRDVSRMPSLRLAQQKLQGLGVRMLGVVVIGADNEPGSQDYKYTTKVSV